MNVEIGTTSKNFPSSGYGGEIYYPESDGKPMVETDIHRKLMLYLTNCLEIFLAERENVYVTGNIMFYYVEGEPQEVVSPDVMVCFGVPKGDRTSYKTWEENDVVPSVVIELSSRSTWGKDRVEKKILYELLGVKEYYIFSPKIKKNEPILLAYKLENSVFVPITIENNRVPSEILGLELVMTDGTLRLFDLNTRSFLKTQEELSQEVGELSQEVENVSAENLELKAEIKRLKALLKN
jgi:Uma2 family endonuclease